MDRNSFKVVLSQISQTLLGYVYQADIVIYRRPIVDDPKEAGDCLYIIIPNQFGFKSCYTGFVETDSGNEPTILSSSFDYADPDFVDSLIKGFSGHNPSLTSGSTLQIISEK